MSSAAVKRTLSFVRWFFNASPTWVDPQHEPRPHPPQRSALLNWSVHNAANSTGEFPHTTRPWR